LAQSSTAAARQPLMLMAGDPSTVSFWSGRRSQLAAAWSSVADAQGSKCDPQTPPFAVAKGPSGQTH
jgi:hypothetical protein